MGKVDLVFVLEIYQSNNVMQTVLFSPAYNAANEPNLRNSGILAVMAKALSPLLHRGLSGRATERSAGVRTNTIQGVKKRKEVASSFWIASNHLSLPGTHEKSQEAPLLESSLPVPD
ncbi:hypothetical protein V1477_009150 [Vespula maculifrons]|uniref:Uncharacterized protein n=2 Tax=Vespula TaxID=7451 RepID=A0A834KL43_VESVU|nr:hypothetical protein HZH66_003255 [Vespula vulgaris]